MNEEYNILKDQLFNGRETYNFIDKIGYDDWNKKQVIREYIEHMRNERQRLEHNWNELKKHIETKIKIINETYLDYEEEWNEDFIADIYSRKIAYENILEKIEELEEGGNNG